VAKRSCNGFKACEQNSVPIGKRECNGDRACYTAR
jgi:hypothetical protein